MRGTMSYAILAVIMLIMVVIGVCVIAYADYLHEQRNDIAEQIIREHQKEIEELKKKRYYE